MTMIAEWRHRLANMRHVCLQEENYREIIEHSISHPAMTPDDWKDLHDSLDQCDGYLGNEKILDHVEWVSVGKNHRLVWKKKRIEETNETENEESNKDDDGKGKEKTATDSTEGTPSDTDDNTKRPLAALTAVFKIHAADCYMDLGKWKPTKYSKNLSKAKLSCSGTFLTVDHALWLIIM